MKFNRLAHLSPLITFSIVALALTLTSCATTEEGRKLSGNERANLLIEVASGSINEGDPTGALITLEEAEQINSKLPELHHLRAVAYYYKKDLVSAIVSARRAVELRKNYSDANNTLGKLLLDSGRYAEAEKYLMAASKDPLYRDAYKPLTSLGILHYKRGEFSQAENILQRAIDLNPTLACAAYYYRGQIRLKDSKFETAIRDFEKATQKYCGDFQDAHLALGMAYSRSKQYAKARKKFIEIQQANPNSPASDQAMEQLRYLP